ncbi:hypothetical protein FEZ51_02130 [Pediococcus stilesii]|uniref:HK97 gp10 family phage protein n=1 Tax=Pediococcus stilesii TaxID=331679 RepID=A0A5R9BXL8_9LACO|nr:HK97-gp10 family putative phage morphogenesis protein [Pediococcus stilesii]TLQ05478.1 hypothetical protein FEZ51_02130 [Pediococcus stilesii]
MSKRGKNSRRQVSTADKVRPYNYSEIPAIRYAVEDRYSNQIDRMIRALEAHGAHSSANHLKRQKQKIKRNTDKFLKAAATDARDEASNYLRTVAIGSNGTNYSKGFLFKTIKVKKQPDGSYQVAPLAVAKSKRGWYAYGAALEFGTQNMTAEPFMRPSSDRIRSKVQSKFIEAMRASKR